MEKLELFRKERERYNMPISIPLDGERAKLKTEDRIIKGYAIVWGSKNDYNEIVVKGATLNSLNARGVNGTGKNKIVVLNQHRQSEPIARITVLQEDDYGLYFEAEVTEGVSYAEEALKNIRANVLNQLSYGFNYIWDKVEYDAVNDAYILREIKLYEISVVTFSSDENAQLRSFKGYQDSQILSELTPENVRSLKRLLETLDTEQSRDEHSEKVDNETISNKPTFF